LPADVHQVDGKWVHMKTGEAITVGGIEKMSKSKKNVIDPENIIETYGADTARWFMLSDTPPERDIEWTSAGAEGAYRFVQRIWRLVNEAVESQGGVEDITLRKLTHRSIDAVTGDLENLRFNRAIARVYELANGLHTAIAAKTINVREAAETLVLLSAPMMPHLAETCWQVLGHTTAIVNTPWPKADPALLVEDMVTIGVQVNGKRRDEVTVSKGISQADIEPIVMAREAVVRSLDGKPVKKFILVPDRIVNIVC
jgi:leucyl-tRNA synthetase